jgi:hypothetical protein
VPGKADLSRDESEETTFSLEMRQHTRSTNSIDKHIAPLKYPYVCFEESWLQGRLSCRFFAVEYLPTKYIRNTLVRVPSHAALLNGPELSRALVASRSKACTSLCHSVGWLSLPRVGTR